MTIKKSNTLKEIISVIIAIIVALSIRTFIFEPFTIPSPSMYPTLIEGDYVIVNKLPYGVSKHSILFSPNLFSGRLFQYKQLERGDITVFKNPHDESEYWIKRLIGLPGDKIQVKNGNVILNNIPLKQTHEGIYEFEDSNQKADLIQEFLPSGRNYSTLSDEDSDPGDNTAEFTVPEHHYFFMGDNRDHSSDSRFTLGFVHEDYIIGKAQFMLFSNNETIFHPFKWIQSFKNDRFVKGLYNESFIPD